MYVNPYYCGINESTMAHYPGDDIYSSFRGDYYLSINPDNSPPRNASVALYVGTSTIILARPLPPPLSTPLLTSSFTSMMAKAPLPSALVLPLLSSNCQIFQPASNDIALCILQGQMRTRSHILPTKRWADLERLLWESELPASCQLSKSLEQWPCLLLLPMQEQGCLLPLDRWGQQIMRQESKLFKLSALLLMLQWQG